MASRFRFTLVAVLLFGVIAGAALPALAQGPLPEPELVPTTTPEPVWAAPPEAFDPSSGTPTPTDVPRWAWMPVEVTANDGLTLFGEFYWGNPAGPTVLLLHQLYADRTSWDVITGALTGTGFNVLAVDVRGHGMTGGALNWWAAVDDVGVWFTWLHESGFVRPDAIATMGSSMGSSLALIGCAQDDLCRTAIGISPGWNYHGLNVHSAFAEQFGPRPVLLIYAVNDMWPSLGVPRMIEVATNEITTHELPGNAHGMDLFATDGDTLIPVIVQWLLLNSG